jgi:NAD(P)-dependent dehydrogenase (short-subunit alcohol dehydrogenase family)
MTQATGRLLGKVALITGAGSGIGKASAELFAREGAKVVAVDQSHAVMDVAKGIVAAGGEAIGLVADAGSEAEVEKAIATAVATYGSLDVCWANAGVSGGLTPMLDADADEWTRILRINLVGAFLAVKYAAKTMLDQGRGGSILCTASVAALRSGAGGPPYAASKAGVVSLVQTACQQLAGSGIRVNAICPGLIETGMTKPMFDRARDRGTEAKLGQLNPLRRAGAPIEIAQMALFLASDDASYVNGQAFVVDGGLSSSHPVARPGAVS